ncbi:MAG: family 1 encapsulin nanocompartment shell protein [Armatimonadota bacterium]
MRYLPREDAPISGRIWDMIDGAVVGAAKSQLAGRRLLEITGPYGFGYRAFDRGEKAAGVEVKFSDATAALSSAEIHPIPMVSAGFMLPIRDVATAEEQGIRMELSAPVNAGVAAARLEDKLIFEGSKPLGLPGLLNAPGSAKTKLGNWTDVGKAMDDLIAAVGKLDSAGFPGPYAAALAPALYNALFLRYPDSDLLQIDQARQLITGGITKAVTLKSGGVVIAVGRYFATIVMGQDMTTAYVGPSGTNYEFVIVESLAPRVIIPETICVLESA